MSNFETIHLAEGSHSEVAAAGEAATPLLEIDNLRTWFFTRNGVVRAVDGVSLRVSEGETLAVVGESGCGKSVTALSVMRLLATPPARTVSGRITFQGRGLLGVRETQRRQVRGKAMAMLFQEPMTSLNPVLTIGRQIGEAIRIHQSLPKEEVRTRALEMLKLVQIPEPERRLTQYPHELSGGMRQRVMIAMALACSPKLLVADEPTTALDVTIQAQILDLMRGLKSRTGAAIILITHDLGVVAEMAERVVVLYAGRNVEEATVQSLFESPHHPYTVGLLDSVPRLGASLSGEIPRLADIPGTVPSLAAEIVGCPFAPRCGRASALCMTQMPPLEHKSPNHSVACWHPY